MTECEIRILIKKIPKPNPIDEDDCSVEVGIGIDPDNPPDFMTLMAAAEYLTAVVACESNAGYERALELIIQGAMTYKHILKPEKN
jgi:hypothetical protein